MLQSAYADNSNRVYNTALNAYSRFACNLPEVHNTLSTIEDLSLFIAYLSINKFSSNTIITYTCAICQDLKFRTGLDLGQHFIIKRIIKSVKKTSTCDLRLPITRSILHKLTQATLHVCRSQYEAMLFSSIFNLAFHGLFRISELVATQQARGSILRFNHVCITGNRHNRTLTIKLAKSKTDQLSHSCNVSLREQTCDNIVTCPIVTMEHYLRARPSAFGSFYVHADGRAVTASQCNHVLQSCLKFAGVAYVSRYSSHSFRIGGCTSLARMGVSEEELKLAGRWRSDTYKKYVRRSTVIPRIY